MDLRLQAFERLLNIMDDLRAKCPWDNKQSLESLRYLSIEEVYELSDAILDKDMEEIKRRLDDFDQHVAQFHSNFYVNYPDNVVTFQGSKKKSKK